MAQPTPPPIGTPGQQSNAPREPHLLSLKVLRAARPALVPSSHPYYESSSLGHNTLSQTDKSSIDAHKPGEHGLTGALVLPSTFGTIYLGETFSALLCLSNDTQSSAAVSTALSPVLKVEMHTTGAQPAAGGLKHHLATIYAPTSADALASGQSVEGLVSHEIKELGLHALVCTVTYGCKLANGNTVSRSFRKVYKFQVSNPLSVRTKAHSASPLSATSSLSATERSKVFLEVQVQNLGEHAMSFERMQFDPIPNWSVTDLNAIQPIFEGDAALLAPNSVRQYIYILQPPEGAPNPPPGSSQPLGRLDILWRTPHGETGRLQTSMLGRRIPAAPPTPAPAPVPEKPALITPIPPTLNPPSSLKTPAPYRPSHLSQSVTENSPAPSPPPPPLPILPPLEPSSEGLEFDLTVESILPLRVSREQTFTINFNLHFKDVSPPSPNSTTRTIRLAAQFVNFHENSFLSLSDASPLHLAPIPTIVKPPPPPPPTLSIPQSQNSQNSLLLPSTTPLPSSIAGSRRSSMESARSGNTATPGTVITSTTTPSRTTFKGVAVPPPTPFPSSIVGASGGASGQQQLPSREVVHLGSTLLEIGTFTFPSPSPPSSNSNGEVGMTSGQDAKFSSRYLALESALVRIGGVRVFLMESKVGVEGEGKGNEEEGRERRAKCVWERNVVAEVWVASSLGGGERVGR